MNILTKTSNTFLFLLLTTVSFAAIAEESTIPVPQKRPSVMHVSPAFIEQLKNQKSSVPVEIIKITPAPELSPTPPSSVEKAKDLPPHPQTIADGGKSYNMPNIEKAEDILNILEPTKTNSTKGNTAPPLKSPAKLSSIPIPGHKPSSLDDISPASGEENNETTLVSFALKPEQIHLDNNLRGFLEDHAVRLLQNNKTLKMEIYAYATPIDQEDHSDIRISLARALEVRSFLIDHNISPNRLKLKPVGKDPESASNDRIDLIFMLGS